MTRNDPHALRTLPPTDSASDPHPSAVIAHGATLVSGDESAPESAGAIADGAGVSLAMRVLAWLPLRLWTDCGVCLFWRGAVVGALAAGALATAVSALL